VSVATFKYSRRTVSWVPPTCVDAPAAGDIQDVQGRVTPENLHQEGSRLLTHGLHPSCKYERPKKTGICAVNAVIHYAGSRPIADVFAQMKRLAGWPNAICFSCVESQYPSEKGSYGDLATKHRTGKESVVVWMVQNELW
jgi:hypothetical protein